MFTDRIEILSHGGLVIEQDETGFYNGSSLSVNEVLASIFLQLRISERSGRGVPKIVAVYGKDSIKIEKNRITVTIPFKKNGANSFEVVSNKVFNKVTNKTEDKIVELIRYNPNITIQQIMIKTGLSEPGVKKNLKQLKDKNIIKRVGSNKTRYWKL
ncbi:MAG: ATP-binding protein [Paludibacter sp.]|nr:ATP-binding protein [Paludibacter sp.]